MGERRLPLSGEPGRTRPVQVFATPCPKIQVFASSGFRHSGFRLSLPTAATVAGAIFQDHRHHGKSVSNTTYNEQWCDHSTASFPPVHHTHAHNQHPLVCSVGTRSPGPRTFPPLDLISLTGSTTLRQRIPIGLTVVSSSKVLWGTLTDSDEGLQE
jgi:hypothetical protein